MATEKAPGNYIFVDDDGEGTLSVYGGGPCADDAGHRAWTYGASNTKQDARRKAEAYAKGLAKEYGCDYGCNYP